MLTALSFLFVLGILVFIHELGHFLVAKKVGIKVVALVDTSSNPELVDYAIPTNNDSIASIKLILGAIKQELLPFKK